MIRINLLPYRAQQAKQKRQQFAMMAILSAILAGLCVAGMHWHYSSQVSEIRAEQQKLNTAIASMDARLTKHKQDNDLQQTLSKRIALIESLKASRELVATMLHEFPAKLPDDVYLSKIMRKDTLLSISGVSEHQQSISQLMRQIEHQDPYANVYLHEISGDQFVIAAEIKGGGS